MYVRDYLVQSPNPREMCGIARSSQSQALSSTPLPLILQSSIQQWLRVNSCQEPGKEPWARHSLALAEFSVQQECREPAYCILSAALSQHNLSGSGIAQLEFYHCQEPAWGTPPVAKVMRKEAQHTQRWDRASGVPPGNSRASTPKTRVCLLSALCSHLHLWLYRGLSPTTSLWKKS